MRVLYLSYEIKSREIYFLREIAQKIISTKSADIVYIGNKYIIFRLATLGLLIPGIILIKSAQEYLAGKLKKIKDKGFKFVLQDAESICQLYEKGMGYDLFMKHPKSLNYIETIYTAIDIEHKSLKNFSKICKSRKVGFLRFSYLTNQKYFNKIYKEEINSLKKMYGNYTLILTSGTAYKFPHSGIKSFRGQQGMNDDRWKLTMDWANYSHKNLFSILEFIRIFIENTKDKKIIFRPHPSESKDFYLTLFNGIKNVIIDNNYSLHATLAGAENIILPPFSTTSFEAALMEKRILYLLPSSKGNFNSLIRNHTTAKLGEIYNSPLELFKALKIKKESNMKNLLIKKKIAKDFLNLKNDSLKNFCDDIKLIFKKSSLSRFTYKTKSIKIQDLILKISSYLFFFITNIFFTRRNFSYLNYKLKGFKFDKNKFLEEKDKVKNVDCGIFEKIF